MTAEELRCRNSNWTATGCTEPLARGVEEDGGGGSIMIGGVIAGFAVLLLTAVICLVATRRRRRGGGSGGGEMGFTDVRVGTPRGGPSKGEEIRRKADKDLRV